MGISKYVEQENKFRAMLGQAELDLRDPRDRQRIAEMIDAALSPENLTCDGELPRSQVQARYRMLCKAAQDLYRLDPNVRFSEFMV
jgi:hypothetical protein